MDDLGVALFQETSIYHGTIMLEYVNMLEYIG